ncbi:SURF1 family protein [Thalassotalea sp. ND16A]|uniref:SURF1 family protein n=1 Tax=Thalassotalea sp. ND16A TaxID=1535422 RepID=UPI00051A2A8D|nr:SURF1 family protein [Thalassotalea sp. ND16A]
MHHKTSKTDLLKSYLASWRLPWVIFTLLVFCGLIKLSLWQYDRGQEKQTRLDNIAQLSQQQAMPLSELLTSAKTNNIDNINDVPVQLSGSFNNQFTFLLDNQTHQGQLGYRVLQVFHDSNSNQQLLVNLGWIVGSIDRNFIPSVAAIKGRQTLSGNVRIIEQGIVLAEQQLSTQSSPIRVQQIDIEKISQLINIQLLPFVVFLDKKDTLGYEKNWQPVVMPPEKHQGYAFQWLSLAIAWLSLMCWASVKIYRSRDGAL